MTGSTCAFVSINSAIAGSILRIPVGVCGGAWGYNELSPNPKKKNHITSSRNFFISSSTPRKLHSISGQLYTARYTASISDVEDARKLARRQIFDGPETAAILQARHSERYARGGGAMRRGVTTFPAQSLSRAL